MGVGVSNWRLARAVAEAGHLGVVSGTSIDVVMVRRLQQGDEGGHVRRALAAYPVPEVAEDILKRYFIEGGKAPDARFRQSSMNRDNASRRTEDLLIAANFVEVYLAKEGHDGPVGINYLEKVQAPHLPSLFGAMLAGVDYVLMGAGIPKAIPAVLDDLAACRPTSLKLDVKGADRDDDFRLRFDPGPALRGRSVSVRRPRFLAIISSHILATMLARKIEVPVDGFVVELPTAGGHNAPPRGPMKLTEGGEPLYGDRDVPDLEAIRDVGLPFWLAGGYAQPERVAEAKAAGAVGVQVGTPFAYCEESGFDEDIKRRVIKMSQAGEASVFTDPIASPSGFPFKVVQVDGTLSEADVYTDRERICDLGYLRHAYKTEQGAVGWRCSAEPVEDYVRKGGDIEDTVGRKCLCNALMSNIGLGQIKRSGKREPILVTSGDAVAEVAQFLPEGQDTFTAADVISYLLGDE
jgi:nitronate monooxygenase